MRITYDMVRDDIPSIIEIKGEDYEYTPPDGDTCLYTYDGKPSCIIGHYLVSLGVPVEAFDAVEGNSVDCLFTQSFLETYGITASAEAVRVMHELQSCQDSGIPWGQAYERVFKN